MADHVADSPGFRWFCDRLKSGRYWCKLSGADRNTRIGSPYDDTKPGMRALMDANPDRLVWGSDWPHIGHQPSSEPDDSVLMRLLKDVAADAELVRRILVDNAEALYGFPRFAAEART
jgi:predicted TIM-barrel fold metal-dependent hydrolase